MEWLTDLFDRALTSTQNDPRFVYVGLCMILAGLFKSIQDRLDNEGAFATSVFRKLPRSWWLKSESWVRKYARYKHTNTLIVEKFDEKNRPVYKPAFKILGLRSDKSLVMFTDGWHLAQFFTWSCACAAPSFAAGFTFGDWRFWVFWVLTKGMLTGWFSVGYDSIFRARRV